MAMGSPNWPFQGGGLNPSTPGVVQRNAEPGSPLDIKADEGRRRGAELDENLRRYGERFGSPKFSTGPARNPTTPNPRPVKPKVWSQPRPPQTPSVSQPAVTFAERSERYSSIRDRLRARQSGEDE